MQAAPLIVRAGDRFVTSMPWLDSRHCFSFGAHYDPTNIGFGVLMVSNDEVVAPGAGFETHPHRDAEIVTWVLSGTLVHQDSQGNSGIIYPGLAQRMSAGRGILHSEKNGSSASSEDASDADVHYVQMWVRPDETGLDPGYQQTDVNDQLATGGLVCVASGMRAHRSDTAIHINQRGAALFVAKLAAVESVQVPTGAACHLYVARGSCELEGVAPLSTGDSVRGTDMAGRRVTAGASGAELLMWLMHQGLVSAPTD